MMTFFLGHQEYLGYPDCQGIKETKNIEAF